MRERAMRATAALCTTSVFDIISERTSNGQEKLIPFVPEQERRPCFEPLHNEIFMYLRETR